MRGLRFSIRERTMFRVQLQAIMEAAATRRDVSVLLPMVASAEDLERAIGLVDEVARALGEPRPRLGAMLETPSALFELDDILKLIDFACLGTNDLAQFMLGVERRTLGPLSEDAIFQPALLRAVHHVARRAEAHAKPLTVCGEAAGDPRAACLLVGVGLDALSMSPVLAARVRAALRAERRSKLAELALRALEARTRPEVVRIVNDALESHSPEHRVLESARSAPSRHHQT
jgi:phosphoenolpyruvate-protein kinase (PTS system EI component)